MSVIYHSSSQSKSEFDLFLPNFEKLLSNISKCKPSLSVIIGDFNVRSSWWWRKEINAIEGSKLFWLTSSNGFPQSINEATHLQISSSSCTDLIFIDQPNLSVNSGVHASLNPNYHHQIVHSSFNINIAYSPLYQRLIWDYKRLIQKIFEKPLI